MVFVQCTSPFIDPGALANAVRRVASGDVDVAFSAAPTYEFLWSVDPDDSAGLAKGLEPRRRRPPPPPGPPARLEGDRSVLRHGRGRLPAARHRFFGRVGVEPVTEADAIEIDTPEQVEVARALARGRRHRHRPVSVVALVTDFDGVHTDDRASLNEDGSESVVVSRA